MHYCHTHALAAEGDEGPEEAARVGGAKLTPPLRPMGEAAPLPLAALADTAISKSAAARVMVCLNVLPPAPAAAAPLPPAA